MTEESSVQQGVWSDLHEFAHEGNMSKIKLWIDGNRHRRFFNAMLNATDANGSTSLIVAATEGRADVVKELIACRADVSIRTPLGNRTAMHWAALNGHVDVVQELINGDASSRPKDVQGSIPMDLAVAAGALFSYSKVAEGAKAGDFKLSSSSKKGNADAAASATSAKPAAKK